MVAHRGQTEPDAPLDVEHFHHPALDVRADTFLREVRDTLRTLGPDVVVHMNPSNDRDASLVVDTFAGIAQRVVAISSMDVYRAHGRLRRLELGPYEPIPLFEDSPLRQRLFLDGPLWENILAERAIQGHPDIPATVLRWPTVYGPRDPFRRISRYLQQMKEGATAILIKETHANHRHSRGYTENLALSIMAAVLDERSAGRTYNVAEPDALSEVEWIGEIGRIVGWSGEIRLVPGEEACDGLLQNWDPSQHLVMDTARIRQELDYREEIPRTEALKRTVDWEFRLN